MHALPTVFDFCLRQLRIIRIICDRYFNCHPERSASAVEVLRSGVSEAKPPSKARRDLLSSTRSFRNIKLLFTEKDGNITPQKAIPLDPNALRSPSLRSGFDYENNT